MKVKLHRVFTFVCIALILLGCGVSNPTESEARAILEKSYESSIKDGTVKIISFKKVDGQAREGGGVKFYLFSYEAELEYPKGRYLECENPANVWVKSSCMINGYEFKSVGAKEKVTGQINFERTEKGWNGNIEIAF
jgi:hypothetical protein